MYTSDQLQKGDLVSCEITAHELCSKGETAISNSIEMQGSEDATLGDFDTVYVTDTAFVLTGGAPLGGEYSGPGVTEDSFTRQQLVSVLTRSRMK